MNYIRIDKVGMVRQWGTCASDAQFSDDDGLTTILGVVVPHDGRKWRYVGGCLVDLGPMVELTYALQRKNSYPSIGEQLDALYKAGVFPPEMAEQIAAVKAKYPKP